jgi:TusA-related sulfurtransferase
MTVLELKKALRKMPDNAIIQVLDLNKNAGEDALGEGSAAGCYPIEEVAMLDANDVPDDTAPWVYIKITDPDYPYEVDEDIDNDVNGG